MQKKRKLNLLLKQLNSTIEDPTIIKCTFIIMDFEKSGNNVIVDKETALEAGKTLLNKPIVTFYQPPTEPNTRTDNLGDHEMYIGEDRNGNMVVKSNTVPIGVFTSEGYETTISVNGEDKEVMAADAVLWRSRFPDAIDLIEEWFHGGVDVVTSCEYLYSNFSFQDGVEYHHSPIFFEGHCVLASSDRGDQKAVTPAYDSSKLLSINQINKFNRLVAQAINQKDKEESNTMKYFKKVCELSHSDIRSLLYAQLDPTLGESEYSWISDVYDTYFVSNIYSYADGNEYDKYFKFSYTKDNDVVTINFDSKSEVALKRDWVEVTQVQQMQNQLDEKTQKVKELETQLNTANSKADTLSTEKEAITKQFNSASEKIVELSTQVEELKPFKNQVEKETLDKALNEKKDYYSAKFNALNAAEKFEAEEVQDLISKSIFENEEGKQAILQLNTMLVDMVTIQSNENAGTIIRETSSKRENLIPTDDDFDSRYSM
ncbi:hypothetical protein COE51_16425 [Bacillus pseudomycoides]|nr:hypothetical protein COE51_16425 [Bacillus pseudomycoides]